MSKKCGITQTILRLFDISVRNTFIKLPPPSNPARRLTSCVAYYFVVVS